MIIAKKITFHGTFIFCYQVLIIENYCRLTKLSTFIFSTKMEITWLLNSKALKTFIAIDSLNSKTIK